jgi:ATP-dependent Lon protease
MATALQGVEGAARLADFIAGLIDIPSEEKQSLLETVRPQGPSRQAARPARAPHRGAQGVARRRRAHARVDRRHEPQAPAARADAQIQKELGEDDEGKAELADLEKQIADAGMPKRSRRPRARN